MVPEASHKYMMLLEYDLGHTLAMAAIPLAGWFTPRYYTVVAHWEDDVQVLHGGKTALKTQYPVNLKKQITGKSDITTEYGISSSKIDGIYLQEQSKAVSGLLADLAKS